MATKNRRALELKLGKLGIIMFVGGMSLLLFVMFLLGVFAGKHMEAYPERYSGGFADLVREPLAWLAPQKEESPRPDLAARNDSPAKEETFGLTFYKTLVEKKDKKPGAGGEEVADNRVGAGTVVPQLNDKSNSSAGLESPPPVSEHAGAETSVSVPPQRPADRNAVASGVSFEVQAAAYRDARQAEQMVKKLKRLGFTPRIVPKDIPNKGKWFRIIAGDFASRQDAEAASLKIAAKIAGVKCVIRYKKGNGT
jgi:cell division septation protein DedD